MDLSFADLGGANLRYASLKGSKLDSADLRLADFSQAQMSHSSLILADCRGSTFISAKMIGVLGLGANLSVLPAEEIVSLQSSIGREGAHWQQTPLPKLNREAGQPATMGGASLLGSQWTGANFTGADLSQADFRHAVLGTDVFRYDHPGFWKFLWWVIQKDDRWRAVGSTRMGIAHGKGVEWVPANFSDTRTTGALFERCAGPDLEFTDKQLASCKSPVDPEELRGD
ncbi:pentapeptide repeat-containing protein [Arthrobacter sp. AET 35A]|uniref:pentapeptide repeat-containing protein n=1 Tax=Arthrobacter sp. AET 35A TaxID=2292643 RepID=UPI001492E6D6|nr:pentapeptide repeat-containing protein [Arthrobacter sp. AET 35A]NOJ64352.1 pentapeptide repeat-containing protein [Arthrobacter sp. 147(2020)]